MEFIKMDTALILKVVGIGLLVSVSCQILNKSGRDEQAMLVTLSGIIIVLLMVVGEISELLTKIRELFGSVPYRSFLRCRYRS